MLVVFSGGMREFTHPSPLFRNDVSGVFQTRSLKDLPDQETRHDSDETSAEKSAILVFVRWN
ncbi:hypothetical protein, partial [Akkermansia sp.]|uniref:hypothetical protein n=1 Tax=Akkermansia sp. TaxID=1872421 RepID=UPI003AB3D039